MTPLQRAQERFRRQLQVTGTTDVATQDAVVAYVAGELTARQPLLEKGQQLMVALRANAISDAQAAALLNDYLAAVEDDQVRQLKALATLQKTVDFTKAPKVEALLALMGVYGNGPIVLGGNMGLGAEKRLKPPANRPNQANGAAPGAPATPDAAPAPDKI